MTKPFVRHDDDKDAATAEEVFEQAVEAAARARVLELGPGVLFYGPLLADWFIRHQL